MTNEMKPEGNFRLIGLYKTDRYFDFIDKISNFSYYNRNEEIQTNSLLTESEMDRGSLSALQMLHPQARHFLIPKETNKLRPSVKLFFPDKRIESELNRTVWQAKAPNWSQEFLSNILYKNDNNEYTFLFNIQNIQLSLFPTGIIIINMIIKPSIETCNSNCQNVIQMMINSLHYTGKLSENGHTHAAALNRYFSHPKQKESALRRFGHNNLSLFQGLSGQESISIEDIFVSFLPENYKKLLGDRFINCGFIKTQAPKNESFFSEEDFADLIRVARGESKRYIPLAHECQAESDSITMTFENVAFALSAEGIACWIKPTEDQAFLKDQFVQRFNTIYFQLFQLAIHQRYILIDMAERLDEATPSLIELKKYHESGSLDGMNILKDAQQLRNIRSEVANFYLRAYFKQPAALSNHQEFYTKLQSVFGISDLFNEVQQATNELDYLINSLQERINDEQHTNLLSQMRALMHRQEQSAHIEFLLTIIVEAIAIPYYTFNFLAHAFHLDEHIARYIGIGLAGCALLFTFRNMKKSKKGEE